MMTNLCPVIQEYTFGNTRFHILMCLGLVVWCVWVSHLDVPGLVVWCVWISHLDVPGYRGLVSGSRSLVCLGLVV